MSNPSTGYFIEPSFVTTPAMTMIDGRRFDGFARQRAIDKIRSEEDKNIFKAINKAAEDAEYLEIENIIRNRKAINLISVLEI